MKIKFEIDLAKESLTGRVHTRRMSSAPHGLTDGSAPYMAEWGLALLGKKDIENSTNDVPSRDHTIS